MTPQHLRRAALAFKDGDTEYQGQDPADCLWQAANALEKKGPNVEPSWDTAFLAMPAPQAPRLNDLLERGQWLCDAITLLLPEAHRYLQVPYEEGGPEPHDILKGPDDSLISRQILTAQEVLEAWQEDAELCVHPPAPGTEHLANIDTIDLFERLVQACEELLDHTHRYLKVTSSSGGPASHTLVQGPDGYPTLPSYMEAERLYQQAKPLTAQSSGLSAVPDAEFIDDDIVVPVPTDSVEAAILDASKAIARLNACKIAGIDADQDALEAKAQAIERLRLLFAA